MTSCKLILIACLLMGAISLSIISKAAPPAPLNAVGEDSERISPPMIVQKIKECAPALQDKYLEVKNNADYAALKLSPEWRLMRAQTARLRSVELKELDTDSDKIAFWVNVYNVLVADGIVSLRVKGSVLKTQDFFANASYNIGGFVFNLEEIEHGILRGNRTPEPGRKLLFDAKDPRLPFMVSHLDPRIHFALNCGARSCPPVNVYTAGRIEEQLDSAAKNFINGPDVRVDEANKQVSLSKIFEWYATDFGANKKELMGFLARFVREPAKSKLNELSGHCKINYLPYDWALPGKPK